VARSALESSSLINRLGIAPWPNRFESDRKIHAGTRIIWRRRRWVFDVVEDAERHTASKLRASERKAVAALQRPNTRRQHPAWPAHVRLMLNRLDSDNNRQRAFAENTRRQSSSVQHRSKLFNQTRASVAEA